MLAVDRQGGGSGCNMALDLKRLDPALPVETMGVVGDDDEARFLFAQCDAAGVARAGLLSLSGGATMTVDAFNVKSSGRRTHFYHQGVAAAMCPDHFDFSRTQRQDPPPRPARRASAHGRRRGAARPTAGRRRWRRRAARGSPPISN